MRSRAASETRKGELRAFLARGPATAADAAAHLGIDQSSFSRLVKECQSDVLVVGRARSTRYMARREVFDLGRELPVYEIAEDGGARQLGALHPVLPGAFYFESMVEDADSGHFDDLPYFTHDLRPSGFLGRLVPRRHPELSLPSDIQLWTGNQTLLYIARHGWNLPGNLIVGDEAFRMHLVQAANPSDVVGAEERAARYPELADNVMSWGVPGSSAGGEQPKFLLTGTPGPRALLVKFSPPVRDATSARIADLLVAEHVVLQHLRACGRHAAHSEIIQAGDRVFLEVERFDRLAGGGRRGLISLAALDAEFVGSFASWVGTATELRRQGVIQEAALLEIRWLSLFGRLIGNTDMHGGNLSFFTRGTRLTGLAPVYDMSPAMYAPTQGHLRTPSFGVPMPEAADTPLWSTARAAAQEAWSQIAAHPLISTEFRALAKTNAEAVSAARGIERLLPVR
jgi:hypothetical protein